MDPDVRAAEQRLAQYREWWFADIIAPKHSLETLKGYRQTGRLHSAPELGKHTHNKLTTQLVTTFHCKTERESYSSAQVHAILQAKVPGHSAQERQALQRQSERET